MSKQSRYSQSAKSKQKEEKANKHINFVVVVYVIIMAYLLFLIYHSITKEKINFIYAEPGAIHNEGVFKGLLLRNEVITYSDTQGPIRYFVPEGSKVRQNAYVCSINQDSEMDALIQNQMNSHLDSLNDAVSLTVDDYHILQSKIKDYVLEKNNYDLSFLYSSKDLLVGTMMDMSKTFYVKDDELFDQIQNSIALNEAQQLENGTFYKLEKSGVISYTIDGFEDVNLDTFQISDLKKTVNITDVVKKKEIDVLDPMYKTVDNYLYYIVSEVDPYCDKHLEERNYVTLYFPKKNISIDVKIYDRIYEQDKIYIIYEIDRYFDTFFTDRFVEYKIVYDDYYGLKLPNESVETKALIKVPNTAVSFEKDSYIIQKLVYSDKDTTHQDTIPIDVKVYFESQGFKYISSMDEKQVINVGDEILNVLDPTQKVSEMGSYFIGEREEVEGVYVLNKGYTDFKRIVTVYEDAAFRIVNSDIGYSIDPYDKIASDSSAVEEFMTIN